MMEDEQTEKLFLRLIQGIVPAARDEPAPALRGHLGRVLDLVMEAMGARSAALLLHDPVSEKLEVAACVGAADEELERHVGSLDPTSFAGQVAAHDDTTSLWDVAVTESTVSDALRRSGIHPLLGVRLTLRHELLGIARNIGRADRMIGDMPDASRLRAGERLPLRIDACNLSIVVREVVEELVAALGERFTLEAEEEVWGLWSADELRRAVWNLATNAIKYGANDRPITLRVKRTPETAEVSVHNWGPAIPADEMAQIFRPFARTHGARLGEQKGGLGLTIVRGCAEAHGGRVVVSSTEEAGTTFAIELPPDASRATGARPDP